MQMLLKKKQYGDITTVALILTKKLGRHITPMNASRMLERENSKHHADAVEALRQVIESREILMQQTN